MKKPQETLKIEIDDEKIKKVVLYLLAFLLPLFLLIGIFIYMKVYPFGENTYLPADAFSQYVNFLQYFKNIFTEGESIIYSLSKSIGGEMYGLFAYYIISPYNFLTLFFQKGNMTFVFDIILILKLASCSLTFMYYLNRRRKARFSNLIFSIMYALSGYVIAYGFNIMWLDAVILLPLVVSGIDDLIKKKKCILYIVALTLTLITNYYIGFMVCIFSLLYYIYKTLIGNLKNKKLILKKTGIFIIASICAALITAIILVPVFIGLQSGRADFSFSSMNFDKNFELEKLISKFFTNSFNFEEIQNNSMPPIFCGILANILVLAYFINGKIKIKEKIFSLLFIAIFIISFYIEGANILWSMGNIPAWYIYRYAFCFTFIYIILAKKSFVNAQKGMKIWKWFIIAIIFIGLAVFALNLETGFENENAIKLDILLGILFIILLALTKIKFKDNGKKIKLFLSKYYTKTIIIIIFLLTTANLVYNATYSLDTIRKENESVDQNAYAVLNNVYARINNNLKEYDKGLYRIDSKGKITENDALNFGYNGITYFGSTYSEKSHLFLEKLGYTKYHVNIKCDGDNTKTADMLLGIKYVIVPPGRKTYKNYKTAYEEIYIENNVKIYENPYTLSLGYAVNKEIFNVNMDNKNTFELQNEILKSATGIDEDVYIKHVGEIENTNQKLEEGGKVVYEFKVQNTGNIYLYLLANAQNGFKVNINGEEIWIYATFLNNGMISIGPREIGETIKVEIVPTKKMQINEIYLYYENEEILQKHYEVLNQTQVDLERINNEKYIGKINCDSDKTILFTIPNDKGWKIKVDGKEAQIKETLGALMLVEVEKGEHEITLEYTLPGLKLGIILTSLGVIIFACIIVMSKKNKNN